MSKNEKNLITVNDIEYNIEDFTDAQKAMLNHVQDLDRKLGNAQFNLDQLSIGRQKFVELLAESLENPEEVEEAETVN
jgi:hypothetical protein